MKLKLLKNKFLNIVFYIWELPQNIVGLLLRLFIRNEKKRVVSNITIYYLDSFYGGISLGNTIILGNLKELSVKHEHGHQHQSKMLGPLYLFIIGIPSLIWASMYGRIIKKTTNGYYKFYTEKWANKLGGVKI